MTESHDHPLRPPIPEGRIQRVSRRAALSHGSLLVGGATASTVVLASLTRPAAVVAQTAPSGVTQSPSGSITISTPAGTSAKPDGPHIVLAPGSASGDGDPGAVIMRDTVTSKLSSNNHPQINLERTWSPTDASSKSPQCLVAVLNTTEGAKMSGPSIASVELQ